MTRPLSPCPQCRHAALHTAQGGCSECPCEVLVDWLGPVAFGPAITRPVGRPPLDDPRRHVVRFRLSDAEMLTISSAAVQAGYDSTAAWVRDVALAKASESDGEPPHRLSVEQAT